MNECMHYVALSVYRTKHCVIGYNEANLLIFSWNIISFIAGTSDSKRESRLSPCRQPRWARLFVLSDLFMATRRLCCRWPRMHVNNTKDLSMFVHAERTNIRPPTSTQAPLQSAQCSVTPWGTMSPLFLSKDSLLWLAGAYHLLSGSVCVRRRRHWTRQHVAWIWKSTVAPPRRLI